MGLEQRLIPLSNCAEWERALAGLPYYVAHTYAYNNAMALASGHETFLYEAKADGFHTVCPFSLRMKDGVKDIVSPYGFSGFAKVGNHTGFDAAFCEFMAAQGFVAGYLVMNPLSPYEGEHWQGKECFLLDLTQNDEQRMAVMARDHRSRLRQWWKTNPALSEHKTALEKTFLDLYPASMDRSHASSSYYFGEDALRALLGSPHALLVGVPDEAASLFLYHGDYAEYYLNASTDEGRRHARGLIWHAAQALKNKAVATLNLGCGIREGDELEEFKRRFGGRAQRFAIVKQVYRPEEYRALCLHYGCDPDDRGGFFPPYWKPGGI